MSRSLKPDATTDEQLLTVDNGLESNPYSQDTDPYRSVKSISP
ncbi:hypothetical protein OYT88_08770 [Sporolactobacillus sp. CQH2019]|nr:hypothetical protein [Sporolactobacillus sp. CQH2019]MDD9148640.1 hypothetical protein [Sporolactobacillus sp. CQH2019]